MKIIIAGDFCPQNRVAILFNRDEYASVLDGVKDIIKEVDYSIVNLECPVTKGCEKPIIKWGPNLQCQEKGLEALKWAGFDGVTLANNHFLDFGEDGVENTLAVCEQKGIDTVGGGRNFQEASKVLYKKADAKTLAIINCCEHEFSIATETKAGSNPLNPIQQFYDIQEAKKCADHVLVIIHGGHEHFQFPSLRMQETYRFFVDAGADAVINHHQHCFSGYEVYKGKPIFYGLGNFCFDAGKGVDKKWNEGYMVLLNLDEIITYEIIPYDQCSDQACIRLLEKDSFDKILCELNDIINDPILIKKTVDSYYASCASFYSDIIEPSNNRYYLACKHRGWLPSLTTNKRKLRAANYICCEAHRDKLMYFFYQK